MNKFFDKQIAKKTIIYRFIVILITLSIGYLLTNNIKISIKLAFITETLQTITYYIFEYLWQYL